MPRATISSGYRWRLAIVALVCLLFAGWSAYDGLVKYPRINREAAAFAEYQEEHPENWQSTWPDHAKANNLPEQPEQPKSDFSIIAQFVQVAITLPIGLIFGYGYVSSAGRWLESDESGLTTSGGEKIPYEAISQLNKDRWKAKGIAVASYNAGEGEKRLVIDDWKFERDPTDEILKSIEQTLSPEQIVGGEPEGEDEEEEADGEIASETGDGTAGDDDEGAPTREA
jgi:hypothetical protein